MRRLKIKSATLDKSIKGIKLRDFLVGLGVGLILLGAGGLWDLAVFKANWQLYPMPFELIWLPRWLAGDLFFCLIIMGTIILLVL